MKKVLIVLMALCAGLTGCGGAEPASSSKSESQSVSFSEESTLQIQIGDTILTAALEKNTSADALKELLADGPLTLDAENYGGFEKILYLPEILPSEDVSITAQPGDLLLYQGTSLVLFYGTNTWSYTRIGRIENTEELSQLLSGPEQTVTLSLN